MNKWLLNKAQNMRFSHEISRTQSTVANLLPVERSYVLLYAALMKEKYASILPTMDLALNNPFSFSREEIHMLYCSFEDTRNQTFIGIERIKHGTFGQVFPEKLKRHMLYSLHYVDVIMTTFASALVSDKSDTVRLMWRDLAASHDALPEALTMFLECLSLQEKMLGNERSALVPFSNEEWIARAQWVPSVFLPRTIEPLETFPQKRPVFRPQSGESLAPTANILKAAEQGDAESRFKLGWMYFRGDGVPKDSIKAAQWFRAAADQGSADAQNSLGVMYHYGEGLPQDSAEAFEWYRKAAEQGDARAQYCLGEMYANGDGILKNDLESLKWFRNAANQGYAKAQKWLDERSFT